MSGRKRRMPEPELLQEQEVEKARQVLVEARKDRKIMDKLKSASRSGVSGIPQQEQKRLDEVGINRLYQEKR